MQCGRGPAPYPQSSGLIDAFQLQPEPHHGSVSISNTHRAPTQSTESRNFDIRPAAVDGRSLRNATCTTKGIVCWLLAAGQWRADVLAAMASSYSCRARIWCSQCTRRGQISSSLRVARWAYGRQFAHQRIARRRDGPGGIQTSMPPWCCLSRALHASESFGLFKAMVQ
jgi:hypothetical protein